MTRKTRRTLRNLKTLVGALGSLLGILVHLLAWVLSRLASAGECLVAALVVRSGKAPGPVLRRRSSPGAAVAKARWIAPAPGAAAARRAPRTLAAPAAPPVPGGGQREALGSALRNLGFPAARAHAAAAQVLTSQPDLPLPEALRAALAAVRPH